jgi:hypothetical protein
VPNISGPECDLNFAHWRIMSHFRQSEVEEHDDERENGFFDDSDHRQSPIKTKGAQ